MKRKLLTLLLILILGISQSVGQKREGPTTFNISDSHSITIFTEAPLVWQDGVQEKIRMNITMDRFPTNTSSIDIRLIQFFTTEEGQGALPGSSSLNTTQISLEQSNKSVEILHSLLPHESADRFYINITMLATPRGGGVVAQEDRYSYRFPSNETIVVERDNLVPVVNLYGFPSGTFFQFWLPIYLAIVVLIASPGIIAGVSKVVTVVQNRQESLEAPEEETEEIEEDLDDE